MFEVVPYLFYRYKGETGEGRNLVILEGIPINNHIRPYQCRALDKTFSFDIIVDRFIFKNNPIALFSLFYLHNKGSFLLCCLRCGDKTGVVF